ncbi:hypothetical protein [Weissella confusa]|uniref:hypothetical protein n=1 Tax=Weissella confusa TaxID=1583 RepID=UPI0018F251DD|nr:hypothetical protein [Weissella confusa]MBJ7693364.1 hypothetical protein [Weissella confusa]
MNIESYKKCSSAISLQGREKSVRKSSIRALVVSNFTLVETKEQTEQRKGQSEQQSNGGFNSTPTQNNFNGQQAPQQGGFSPNDMYGNNLPPLNDDDLPF